MKIKNQRSVFENIHNSIARNYKISVKTQKQNAGDNLLRYMFSTDAEESQSSQDPASIIDESSIRDNKIRQDPKDIRHSEKKIVSKKV